MALLNNADAIYFGDRPVDRVYLGARQVWPWTPELLFQNGEQGGAWDFTTSHGLFQDAAGTSPVVAFGDPVGMATDLSGNGNHLLQTTVPARPTYTVDGALHDGVDDRIQAANAGDWTFLHDGTGGFMGASSIYLGEAGGSFGYYGTQSASASSIGISQGQQSVNLARSQSRLAGDGGALSLPASSTGSLPVGVVSSEMLQHANSHIVRWLNGVEFDGAPYDGFVPSANDPAQAITTHISYSNQSLVRRRMLAINRPLTESERASVNAWLMEGVE